MIICPNCGASNPSDAMTCSECMVLLNKEKLPKEKKDDFATKFGQTVSKMDLEKLSNRKIADIMFVFDCTGSMSGEIKAMQEAIIDFASSVTSEGLDIRVGLIEFRDRTIGEEHKLHKFSGEVFTKKIKEFQNSISSLRATGGGPAPESSPDAIMLALEQDFRDCPNKTIVLITDAPPHLPDKETQSYEQVVNKMKEKDTNQFYIVTMLQSPECHVHLKLLEGIQENGGDGLAFELSKKDVERKEHFKKVLQGLAKSISSKSVICS